MSDEPGPHNRDTLDLLYAESCSTFRQYSQHSLTVRLAVIAEGLILLSACGYTIVEKQFYFLTVLSIFGLLFTTLLFLLHIAYLQAAQMFFQASAGIERRLGECETGPFNCYMRSRETKYGTVARRLVSIHATFTSLWIAYCLCLAYSLI
ncbi:MAG: hypothetical protein ABL888_20420 [Pirellulaceae bacterium]